MITPEPVLAWFLDVAAIVTTLGRIVCAAADTVPDAAGDVPAVLVLRSRPLEDTTVDASLPPATRAPTPPPTPAETSASATAAAASRLRRGGGAGCPTV